MFPKRKGNSGIAERWSACETIGAFLGIKKSQVYYTLYEKMNTEGLIGPLLNRSKEAIEQVKAWPEYKKLKNENNDAEAVKLALWFINNVGGTEIARRAFNAAVTALEAMETPQPKLVEEQ